MKYLTSYPNERHDGGESQMMNPGGQQNLQSGGVNRFGMAGWTEQDGLDNRDHLFEAMNRGVILPGDGLTLDGSHRTDGSGYRPADRIVNRFGKFYGGLPRHRLYDLGCKFSDIHYSEDQHHTSLHNLFPK